MDANSILQSYNKATGSSSTPQYKPTGKPKVDSILQSYYTASAKAKVAPTVTPAPKKVAPTPVKKVAATPIVKQAPQTGVQKALKTLGDVSQQAQNVVKTIGKGIEVTFVKPKVISPVPEKVLQQKKQQAQGPVQIKPGQTKLTKTQMSGFAQMTNNITSQIPATIKSAKEYAKDPLNIGKLNNKGQAESRKAAAEGFNDIKSAFVEAVNRSVKAQQKAPLGEKIVRKAESVTGVVNLLFSPIGAAFEVGNTIPVVSAVTKAVSLPFMAAGEGVPKITNNIVDNLPISNKVKTRIKPVVAETMTIAAQLAIGKLMEVGGKKTKATIKQVGLENFEKITKNVIETSGSGRTINLTSDQVRDIYRDLGDKQAVDAFKTLDVAQRVKAVKEGITLDIPSEKIVRIVDKPYWEKIKTILGKELTNKEVITRGQATGRPGFAGYLGDGQHTPQEVVGAVIKAGEHTTPEGKAAIKAALEAQQSGHNIELKQAENYTPLKTEEVKVEQKIPQIERAKDYTSAKDFATEVYSAQPSNQIGLVDPNTITIRDNVDPTSPDYKKLYEDIKANGMKEPVRLTVGDTTLTTDGSNRTHIGRALGIKVPAIVNKGEIKGLKTIDQIYNNQTGADESLLTSDQAKEQEQKDTPKAQETRQKIESLQEDVEMRRQENEAKKSILDQFEPTQIRAMRTIKRSINSRINKGMDTMSVSDLPVYKDNIRDIMSSIGTDSEVEAVRYIDEDLPDALTRANSKEELDKIKVLKSHLTPKEVEVPRDQVPVGEGKLKASKLEARIKGVMKKATPDQIDELGLSTYNQMNKADMIEKAAEYVTNNRQDALDVVRGKKEPPKGIIPEAIYIALAEEAKADVTLATKLASLQATALGQRISILSEIDKDSPVKILNEIYKIREAQFKKRMGNRTPRQIRERVVRQIREKVVKPDKYDWNNFIKSIEC